MNQSNEKIDLQKINSSLVPSQGIGNQTNKLRNQNMLGSLKNYLTNAKKNLEKDEKVYLLNNPQIIKQESIKSKINEEVKSLYEEMKDEQTKLFENKINELKNSQTDVENKITKIEKEMKYNIQSQYISRFSNFILTKYI